MVTEHTDWTVMPVKMNHATSDDLLCRFKLVSYMYMANMAHRSKSETCHAKRKPSAVFQFKNYSFKVLLSFCCPGSFLFIEAIKKL